MSTLSQLDLDVRLQLSGIAYSDLMSKYIDSLRLGKKDYLLLQSKLLALNIYIEILLGYSVSTCSVDNTDYNCVTEEEAQLIFDKISKLTNICFQPIGFVYAGSEGYFGVDAMEIGCDFIIS